MNGASRYPNSTIVAYAIFITAQLNFVHQQIVRQNDVHFIIFFMYMWLGIFFWWRCYRRYFMHSQVHGEIFGKETGNAGGVLMKGYIAQCFGQHFKYQFLCFVIACQLIYKCLHKEMLQILCKLVSTAAAGQWYYYTTIHQ